MKLVPVPTTDEYLAGMSPHWYPFLKDISKRSKETVANLAAQVTRKEIQPILIWDETTSKAVALIGMRYHKRDDDLIGEWVWMTGHGYKQWAHLLPELEQYLKQHVGCAELRPICRPGWWRLLKHRGYHITHFTLEKKL